MVTKGIITSIDFNGNTCQVRIPLFETAGNDPITGTAIVSNTPGSYNGYKVGDVVLVAFEDGKMQNPVIVGKLYLGAAKEKQDPRGTINVETTTASKSASLPADAVLTANVDSNVPNTNTPFGSLASIANNLNSLNTDVNQLDRFTRNQFNSVITDVNDQGEQLRSEIKQTASNIEANVVHTHKDGSQKGLGWDLDEKEWKINAQDTVTDENGETKVKDINIVTIDRNGMSIAGDLKLSGYPRNITVLYTQTGPNEDYPELYKFTEAKFPAQFPSNDEDKDKTWYYGKYIKITEAGEERYILVFKENFEQYDIKIGTTIAYSRNINSSWSTEAPKRVDGQYIWQWTHTEIYSFDGNKWSEKDDDKITCITGADGKDGIAGTPATIYWAKLSTAVHTGKNQKSNIEITPYAKTGSSPEVVDTTAYFNYSLDNGANWKNDDWTSVTALQDNKIVILVNDIKADNIIIKLAHAYTDPNDSTKIIYNEYETETITYSPLNTPIIDLTNDTDVIKYKPDGYKITANVSSTAQVYLGGSPEVANYDWAVTSGTAKISKSNSNQTVTVNSITSDKAIITCTATTTNFKDANGKLVQISKDFVVSREVVVASYWLSFSPVHTGNLQQTDIEVKALAKIGNDSESKDTNAYFRYSWDNGTSWIHKDWTKPADATLIIPKADIQNNNLRIQATHDKNGIPYEDETITYSPLNTPVLDLTNDSAAIAYEGAIKIGQDVESTAAVYLSGKELANNKYTLEWSVIDQSCSINTSGNTVTVTGISSSFLEAKVKCQITNIENYPDITLIKYFNISKQLKGDKGNPGNNAFNISLTNDFVTIPCDDAKNPIWPTNGNQWQTYTTHTVSCYEDTTIITNFAVSNTVPISGTTGFTVVYTEQYLTRSNSNNATAYISNISGDVGFIKYELYKDTTKVAESSFEASKICNATNYYILADSYQIKQLKNGTREPDSITFKAYSNTGAAEPALFNGKWKYYIDGTEHVVSETSNTFIFDSISSVKTKLTVELYLPTTTTLVDRETVYVVIDGADGKPGEPGNSIKEVKQWYILWPTNESSIPEASKIPSNTEPTEPDTTSTVKAWMSTPPEAVNDHVVWTCYGSIFSDDTTENRHIEYSDPVKDNAYALAQGKTTNYYSDTDPSKAYSVKKGDCWFDTGYVKIDTPTTKTGYLGKFIVSTTGNISVKADETDSTRYIPDAAGSTKLIKITPDNIDKISITVGTTSAYETGNLKQWDGETWIDLAGESVTNKLTAKYINALDITAKKITVLDKSNNNKPLFEADGINGTGNVSIANFTVKNDKLYSGDHDTIDSTEAGIYLGSNGLSIGSNFKVTAGSVIISDYTKSTIKKYRKIEYDNEAEAAAHYTDWKTWTSSNWLSEIPNREEGKYIWEWTKEEKGGGTLVDLGRVCITGAKGDTGAPGQQGPQGEQGPQGNPGAPGTTGRSVLSVTKFYKMAASKPNKPEVKDPTDWYTSPPSFVKGNNYYESDRTIYDSVDSAGKVYSWSDVIENSMLTVDFINSLGITAKKITVLQDNSKESNDSNPILFQADGTSNNSGVKIGGFTVDSNRLYAGTPGTSNGIELASFHNLIAYKSNNQGVASSYAVSKITVNKATDLTVYIRSYAESSYDYTMISNPNVSSYPTLSSSSDVKAHTRSNQNSNSELTGYTKVNYYNLKQNDYIYIVYRKDGSRDEGDDTGYLLIPDTTDISITTVGDTYYFVRAASLDINRTSIKVGRNFSVDTEGKIYTTAGKIGALELTPTTLSVGQRFSGDNSFLHLNTENNYTPTGWNDRAESAISTLEASSARFNVQILGIDMDIYGGDTVIYMDGRHYSDGGLVSVYQTQSGDQDNYQIHSRIPITEFEKIPISIGGDSSPYIIPGPKNWNNKKYAPVRIILSGERIDPATDTWYDMSGLCETYGIIIIDGVATSAIAKASNTSLSGYSQIAAAYYENHDLSKFKRGELTSTSQIPYSSLWVGNDGDGGRVSKISFIITGWAISELV